MHARLLWLLLASLALFTLAYQPQHKVALNLAENSAQKLLQGFYPPEDNASWTSARAGIWLPGVGGANCRWRLKMVLRGPQPDRFDPPARAVVRVNGTQFGDFAAGPQEHEYEWEIPEWTLGPSGDCSIEIDSTTYKSQLDNREVGVRLTALSLVRAGGFAFPSLRGLLFSAALVGLCAWLLRVASALALGRNVTGTWREFVDPRTNALAWVLVALWLIVSLAISLNPPATVWWLEVLTCGLLLIAALVWLINRILPTPIPVPEARRMLAIFALALFIRALLDLGRGFEGDIAVYLSIAWRTVREGIQSAYLEVGGLRPPNNPPVLLYPFWLIGLLYRALFSPLFGNTQFTHPELLRFMLRMPALTADLIVGAVLFRWLRQRQGVPFNAIVLATGAYLLNPAVVFDSAYWGQTAAVHGLFMFLSLVAIDRRFYAWAGVALATAVLTKPQALAIAPLILFIAVRERAFLRFTAAGVATALLIISPFLLSGRIDGVLGQYLRTAEYHPFISVNAHNIWWLASAGNIWLHDTGGWGWLTYRLIGVLFFLGATIISLAVVRQQRQMLFPTAAYQSLSFFMLNTQIHENHLLPMFGPLVAAAAAGLCRWSLYIAFTITTFANMALHDPRLLASLGYSENQNTYGTPALSLVRSINAGIQTLLFIVFTADLIRRLLTSKRLTTAANDHSANPPNAIH